MPSALLPYLESSPRDCLPEPSHSPVRCTSGLREGLSPGRASADRTSQRPFRGLGHGQLGDRCAADASRDPAVNGAAVAGDRKPSNVPLTASDVPVSVAVAEPDPATVLRIPPSIGTVVAALCSVPDFAPRSRARTRHGGDRQHGGKLSDIHDAPGLEGCILAGEKRKRKTENAKRRKRRKAENPRLPVLRFTFYVLTFCVRYVPAKPATRRPSRLRTDARDPRDRQGAATAS